MSMPDHLRRPKAPWIEEPLLPSPHWSVHANVTFDGLRGTCELDITVSQWTATYSIDQYSTTTYRITEALDPLLVVLAEKIASTAAQVSPF